MSLSPLSPLSPILPLAGKAIPASGLSIHTTTSSPTFASIPLDVFLEILQYLISPLDLISVSQVSKSLREVLLSDSLTGKLRADRRKQFISARCVPTNGSQVGLEPPSGVSEAAWAALVYGTKCSSCGLMYKGKIKTIWQFKTILCGRCLHDRTMDATEVFEYIPDLELFKMRTYDVKTRKYVNVAHRPREYLLYTIDSSNKRRELFLKTHVNELKSLIDEALGTRPNTLKPETRKKRVSDLLMSRTSACSERMREAEQFIKWHIPFHATLVKDALASEAARQEQEKRDKKERKATGRDQRGLRVP